MWSVVAAGAASCLYAALNLPAGRIDIYFLLLVTITVVLGTRVAIRIPQINVNITVEDTFVFIGLLFYGSEAAILLGAMAGLCTGLRISKKSRTVLFGAGALACAVFVTGNALQFAFGSTTNLFRHGPSSAVIALCLMALVQYLAHTSLGAIGSALYGCLCLQVLACFALRITQH